jgi:LysM repeat protein
MPRNRLFALFTTLALLVSASVSILPAAAQDATGNLLRDPGFEFNGTWKRVATGEGADGGTFFNVPPDWNGWYTSSPSTQTWMNRLPNGFPHSNEGFGFVHGGNRAQNINRGDATFTAAVYQTVAVPEGSNVVGSAWTRMNLNLNDNPNAQARLGIDPNGGTNPFDSDIVWSPWATNALAYTQLTATATATGPSVTLFLYATQAFPSDPNGVYWDDASLTIGGAGGTAPGAATAVPANTPVPTAPPVVPFVSAQGAQEDGSIVHIVQQGDTIDSIGVAYGVTRAQIVALNNLPSITFLQIGQRILIRSATTGAAQNEDDADTTGTPRPTRTPRPTQVAGAPTLEDVEPEEPTETPEPTQTPTPTSTSTPAPTAPVAVADADNEASAALSAAVCITLFEDVNQNRVQESDEVALSGGTLSIERNSVIVDSFATDGTPDPFCFDELEPGEYIALATAPVGFGLTTPDQLRLRLQSGTTLNVNFGAAQGIEAVAPPPSNANDLTEAETPSTTEDNNDNQLQNLGLIVFGLAGVTLVMGVGLTLIMRRR